MIGYAMTIFDYNNRNVLGGPILVYHVERHAAAICTLDMCYYGNKDELEEAINLEDSYKLVIVFLDSNHNNTIRFYNCHLTKIDDKTNMLYWTFEDSNADLYLPPELANDFRSSDQWKVEQPTLCNVGCWKELGF